MTELLVAATILVVGLLAISGMAPTAHTTIAVGQEDFETLTFAQRRLEQLRALPYGSSALSDGLHDDPPPAPGFTQNYTVKVNPPVDPAVFGLKQLTVTVSGPRNRPVQVITLIAQ
jgi:Tfp pilus assembly protein PilV